MAERAAAHALPASAEALADALRDASARDQPIVPWGAGRLQHLGGPPPPGALILGTSALARVLDYTPADLTITVEAGASLGAIQDLLRPHAQWLPWDPPAPADATIGGLLAAGRSGALRLGYGTPRDWALGMRVALGDGRLVKSGGKVVKNVAGYDLHKLHIGALGTLGVIVEVTFKLAPLPERVESLGAVCPRPVALALSEQLRAHPLAPVSLALAERVGGLADLPGDPAHTRLVVRFAGVDRAVERQIRTARERIERAGATPIPLGDQQSQAVWGALSAFAAPSPAPDLLIRAGAPASALADTLGALARCAPPGGDPAQVVGYAGVGLAYARWPIPATVAPGGVAAALEELRAALAPGGYAVVEDAPADLRARLDIWGPPPPTLALMRALKAQWDPRGTLNPGRYLGGL